jgi:LysM repeat protein
VQITSSQGQTQSQPADDEGRFTFEDMAAGPWEVSLQIPDGWQAFTPAAFQVTLNGTGEDCARVRFLVESLACLEVSKVEDTPEVEPEEWAGLSEWLISATDENRMITGTTDEQGRVILTNLQPGAWTVSEDIRPGWQAAEGYPSEQTIDLITPQKPGECQQMTFANQRLYACVDVFKVDGNDETGLPGWEISIKPAADGLTIADITDGTGWVRFSELNPGSYTISERPQAGWTAVTPISTTLELEAGTSCAQVRFENRPEAPSPQLDSATKNEVTHAKKEVTKAKVDKSGCRVKYHVRVGDTLLRISRRYEVSLARLLKFNPIANPNLIYPGQVICIP